MLIEFSVSNYKSFREKKVLDMSSTSDKDHIDDNTFLSNNKRLLKSVAIYGSNASGKTNLFKAIWFMKQFVLRSANNQVDDRIDIVRFLLDKKMQGKPSFFEVVFMVEKTRYKYGFEVDEVRVVTEWLYAYRTNRPQLWFKRVFVPRKKDKYEWTFGNKFRGQIQSWKKQTLENTLFLSRASQLNSEQLKPVHQWFKNLFVLNASYPLYPGFTIDWCMESEENKKAVLQFLKKSDDNSGITSIEIKERDVPLGKISPYMELIKKNNKENEQPEFQQIIVLMSHKVIGTDQTINLNLNEESAGTRKLFSLAAIWLQAISEGRVLIIDELNNSLHPLLAKFLIKNFHDKEINKHGAQLIFTGHDSFLLDLEIFRRDQIWFTEKGEEEGTDLYSLAEYSPRKNESIEKGYLKGRYGAVPYIDETLLS